MIHDWTKGGLGRAGRMHDWRYGSQSDWMEGREPPVRIWFSTLSVAYMGTMGSGSGPKKLIQWPAFCSIFIWHGFLGRQKRKTSEDGRAIFI